jgi:hypothetical protein
MPSRWRCWRRDWGNGCRGTGEVYLSAVGFSADDRHGLGDARSVGDGVSELRFDFGPGYRIYYARRGNVVVILMCGGNKDSQACDIERAKIMAREIE